MAIDIVRFEDNMLRPEVEGTELEVHRIADKIWNRNIEPVQILYDYYLRNGFPEVFEYDNPREIRTNYASEELPTDLTISDIEDVVNFAQKNEDLINSIIEEDKKLRSMIFDKNSYENKFEIKGRVQDMNYEYYNIDFDMDEDGYRISWRRNRTE